MSSAVANPFNPGKLLWHRSEIEAMFAGKPTRGPVSLEWDLSNTCNHGCAFCSFGTQESQGYRFQAWQHFPHERAVRLIPELRDAGVQSITFTGGGEPLMHPHAPMLMGLAAENGIAFGLVTNGFLLRDKARQIIADAAVFLRVSLDSGTPETHQIMHRTPSLQFDTIIDQMASVIEEARGRAGRQLTVGASFCVTDRNWQEIGQCASRLKSIGANYLEVRPTYPTTWRGDGWDFALSNITSAHRALLDARDAYQDDDFQIIGMLDRFEALEHPEKGYSSCQIGPLTSVLGAEGSLWHCCVQRGQEAFKLANVLDKPFAEAWSEAQAKHMANVIDVKKCPRCRYDNYNRLLEGLQHGALHAEFV